MITIYLVRHGEYSNPKNILPGRLPVELSNEGCRQITRVRDYLADKQIARIFSSPVRRCEQSAEIMGGGSVEIIYDLRLAETLTVAQGEDFKGQWVEPFYGRVDKLGGESMLDVQARMVDFWKSLDFESGQNYAICSHGDPLHLLYRYLTHDKRLLLPDDEKDGGKYQSKGSIRPVTARSATDYEIQDFFRP
jgi:broad specificity phosphatase PhoE